MWRIQELLINGASRVFKRLFIEKGGRFFAFLGGELLSGHV